MRHCEASPSSQGSLPRDTLRHFRGASLSQMIERKTTDRAFKLKSVSLQIVVEYDCLNLINEMCATKKLRSQIAFQRDICIDSPTGAGKTLSCALPIVQMLSTRKVRCLRAFVVVPTQDLALKVCAVFFNLLGTYVC